MGRLTEASAAQLTAIAARLEIVHGLLAPWKHYDGDVYADARFLLAQIDTLRQEQAAMTEERNFQGRRALKAEQQRDAARAALEKYGDHLRSCACSARGVRGQQIPICTCGLDAALKAGR